MNQLVISQIEQSIFALPADEQLLLINRVTKKLRGEIDGANDFELQLAEMANDEHIQRELKAVEKDFCRTELDGLKND